MANGIYVFTKSYSGNLEPVVVELVHAAYCIRETTGERTQAAVLVENCKTLAARLEQLGSDEIYAVETDRGCLFQGDTVSQAMAGMLKRMDSSSVLISTTPTGRSVFSRVVARLGYGMAVDYTELAADIREGRIFFIRQNKPSFRESVFATIMTKEGVYPQMVTVRLGVYTPRKAQKGRRTDVTYYKNITLPELRVQAMLSTPATNDTGSILAAEVVVVDGRGAENEENSMLLKVLAGKLGVAIGGTGPPADTGFISSEHQVGQIGLAIRPEVCISLGISGTIQHTESIKGTGFFVATNQDEGVPAFNIADYGTTCDIKDMLEAYPKL